MAQHVFKDLTGQRFGRLVVVKCLVRAYRTDDGKLISTKWLCKCDCGGIAETTSSKLKSKTASTKSCGCLQKERASEASLHDLTGQRFGRLVVLKREGSAYPGVPMWLCLCDCGTEKPVAASSLRQGSTKSCGCFRVEMGEANATHGMSESPEYEVWASIKKRCYDVSADSYQYYGGVGIYMCDRWISSFENFIADMGLRPTEFHSIERCDVHDNYTPENCKWADPIEQANNKTTTVLIEHLGRSQSRAQWCRELNLNYETVGARINAYGWTHDRALSTPTAKPFEEHSKYLLSMAMQLP